MYRYGFLDETQNKLDYVLALTPQDVLERRLQVRRGLTGRLVMVPGWAQVGLALCCMEGYRPGQHPAGWPGAGECCSNRWLLTPLGLEWTVLQHCAWMLR